MIHEDIQLTGSFQASGSFTLPNHASSDDYPNPNTGSMYNDTTDNVAKLYNGTEWVVVGEQTGSAAGAGVDIEYLVAAGGGGGGLDGGGGGGAGGYLSSSLSSIESGSSITVTVGAGGSGWTNTSSRNTAGASGTDSSIASAAGTSFTTVTSTGGGGGGSGQNVNGRDGGSGGGCSSDGTYNTTGGAGTVGQGFDGGDIGTASNRGGGGGGGASAVGQDSDGANDGGDGGNGKQSNITGTLTYYAGGGGGGARGSGYNAGAGGSGGGAAGGTATPNNNGNDGTVNTGGGAGGGSGNGPGAGGDGGSGVAIFAYDTGSASGLGGIKTINGGRMVHTFNSSGTLTIAGADEYPVANGSVFAPVLYTGNGSTQAITGVGFQPDLMFVKNRTSSGENWAATDVVTGFGKIVYPNLTNAQVGSDDTYFTENSDGFDVNTSNLNISTHNYVAWCWKAGGTAVSNTDGTLTAQVSANVDSGFSISTYTGVGYPNSTTATVGHGLNSSPELVIIKKRDSTSPGNGSWVVGTEYAGSGWDGSMYLNSTGAYSNSINYFWNGDPTDSVVKLKNDWFVNGNNSDYVMYSFHSVDGYQKIGSYSGTGVNGNDITTGFRPRFLLVKRTNTTDNWVIVDVERGLSKSLFPDDASNELDNSGAVTVNSTGFEVNGSSGGWNNGTSTYIYLAIA